MFSEVNLICNFQFFGGFHLLCSLSHDMYFWQFYADFMQENVQKLKKYWIFGEFLWKTFNIYWQKNCLLVLEMLLNIV